MEFVGKEVAPPSFTQEERRLIWLWGQYGMGGTEINAYFGNRVSRQRIYQLMRKEPK